MHTPSAPPAEEALRAQIRAWLVLASLGLRLRHAPLVERLGGPAAVLRLPAGDLAGAFDVRGFKSAPPDERARAKAERSADAGLRWLDESGGRVRLPHELRSVADAPSFPLVLFERGAFDLVGRRPALAIVGSRAATPRGSARARALAEAAAREGIVVVSGGALGVDVAAHEGALSAGSATVVVLGDPARPGSDERPERVRKLAALDPGGDRLVTLTPHGPWAPRDKRLWASRNAVIAALADAVVVIEGRARSGTLYTADAARRLSRPVLAVPGDPDDEVAAAPNQLLRDGHATPLLRLEDALWAAAGDDVGRPPPALLPGVEETLLDENERSLLQAIGPRGAVVDVDALALRSGLSAAERSCALLSLELSGWVERVGASYRRVR